jgi:hypothetical protein
MLPLDMMLWGRRRCPRAIVSELSSTSSSQVARLVPSSARTR